MKARIVVPSNVIRDNGEQYFVYTVDQESKSQQNFVKVGPEFNNQTVIDSGLVVGQQLIVKGHSIVSDGSLVNVKNQ